MRERIKDSQGVPLQIMETQQQREKVDIQFESSSKGVLRALKSDPDDLSEWAVDGCVLNAELHDQCQQQEEANRLRILKGLESLARVSFVILSASVASCLVFSQSLHHLTHYAIGCIHKLWVIKHNRRGKKEWSDSKKTFSSTGKQAWEDNEVEHRSFNSDSF